MPTPEARRNRYLVVIASVAVLITAAAINIAGYIVNDDRIHENRLTGIANRDASCRTKKKLRTYLETDSVLRNQQAINSRNSLKAQRQFIKDTEAVLVLLRRAPNQKALVAIVQYFQDQIDLQKTQSANSLKNVRLSEKAANRFKELSRNLVC